MPRGFSVENSAGADSLGSRRLVLGLWFASLTLALACTIGCAPVAQLQAATNSANQAAAKKPITVTAQLGNATQGTPFAGKIVASGGLAPYHFTIRFGKLPSGLALNPTTGAIEGTPTQAGTSEFTVRASSHDWKNLTDLGLKVTVATEKKDKVTVTITPASATVVSGGSQQLSAEVHGADDKKVKWSTSAGTISTSGLFTAPAVTSATIARVTATSADESDAKASAAISITPADSTNLTVSTRALPDASKGTSYSAGLSASGGTQPYTWSITAGSLPGGVSLSDSGIVSGNPSKTGSYSFTAKVTDAASHSATASLDLTVAAVNANTKFDGPAELPRVYVQSALANTPAEGKTWPVADAAGLQTALNSAGCGDTISLKAGATFTGSWTFPGKSCDDQHWIIVRTSAPDSSLPPEGTRITPCFAGVASLPGRPALNCSSTQNVMAKLVIAAASGSGPITLGPGANHYRFLGLEVTRLANAGAIGNLVYPAAGATGNHIVFDRVWMHGTAHDDTTRGIYLSGLTTAAVVDSYFNDFHCESNKGTCTDAQAVQGGLGNFPGGPYKITNNFLESSGENVLFGGGRAAFSPADIEVSHNHFFKPLSWMPGNPNVVLGNHGLPFVVKNHFELKNAQRVLFEGNIAENSWGGFSQPGFTVLLTAKNVTLPGGGPGGCPLCQVTDVTIRNSKFSHMGGGFQIANALADGGAPPFAGGRFSIHDVLLDDINDVAYNGQGQLAQLSTGNNSPLLEDVQFDHITAFPARMLFDVTGGTSPKMPGLVFTNSIVTSGISGITTAGGSESSCAYKHGVPVAVLTSCFERVTFGNNALVNVPSKFPASSWPSGNTLASDGNSVGFMNFNKGDGGDYHLKSSSPFKGASSDGKDLGADLDAIAAATAGAD